MSTEKMKVINSLAASNASRALSKLIDRPVEVALSPTETKPIKTVAQMIGAEEIVAGIYVPLSGDVRGGALLVFPKETSFALSDILVKREPGTTRKLTPLDESALKEVGNVIVGNYFTTFADQLQTKVVVQTPNFSFDMFGAVIDQMISSFAKTSDEAAISEIVFTIKPVTLKGYFILLLGVEELKALVRSLASV